MNCYWDSGGSRERGQGGWGRLGREGSEKERNSLCCFWAVLSPSPWRVTFSREAPENGTPPETHLTDRDTRGRESGASQVLGPTLGKEGAEIL